MRTLSPLGRWTVRTLRALTLAGAVGGTALLATAQAPSANRAPDNLPKKIYTKTAEFKLPVQMDDRTRANLDRVCLYVKAGGGDWVRQEIGPATLPYFVHRVPQDGEYWFSLTTVDKAGRMSPADVAQAPPALRVIVDTKAPVLDVQPWASPENDLCLRCNAVDANLDPGSLRAVAKMPGGDQTLTPYPNHPGVFKVVAPDMLTATIIVTANDQAGNLAVRDVRVRDLLTTAVTPQPQAPVLSQAAVPQAAVPPHATYQPQVPVQVPAALPPAVTSKVELPPAFKSDLPPVPPLPSETGAILPATTTSASSPSSPLIVTPDNPPSQLAPSRLPPTGSLNASPNTFASSNLPPPSSPPVMPNPVPSAPNLRPDLDASPRTPSSSRQVINTARAVLDYRIDQVGPSGVGKVEVYMTTDQGQNWQRLSEDADRRSPIEFDLPGEGLFGIRLAVTNGNGFGGTPPRRGDAPTCSIEVDTSAPFVQLRPIDPMVAGGALEIRWQATDKNLGGEPVNLYYRNRADGPWQVIARNLKNEGVHRWAFPRDTSAQFLVKVEVTDLAGNTARAESPNPIVLDMTEPHASVISVTGLSGRTGN